MVSLWYLTNSVGVELHNSQSEHVHLILADMVATIHSDYEASSALAKYPFEPVIQFQSFVRRSKPYFNRLRVSFL
jgi:hypothetical protein